MAQLWRVVGGADKGGILVRDGESIKAPAQDARLSTGAAVEELELKGDRLSYRLVEGTGPPLGWVSVKITGAKLLEKIDRPVAGDGGEPSASAPGDAADDDSIEAALAELERLRKPTTAPPRTAQEYQALLDPLFTAPDDDEAALQRALDPVAAAVAQEGALMALLWRRALPLLADPAALKPKANLFGLLVEHFNGLAAEKYALRCIPAFAADEPPEGKADGVVVFAMGWGGATPADMLDIVAVYREMYPGAAIVRLSCGGKFSFGVRCECAAGIRAASEAWANAPKDAPRRLLVHLFSNGGFQTWAEMLRSWQALSSRGEPHALLSGRLPPMAEVLRGVILDSACHSQIAQEDGVTSLVQGMAAFLNQVVASEHDGSEAGRKAADTKGKRTMLQVMSSDSPVRQRLMQSTRIQQVCSAPCGPVHELEPPVDLQFVYSEDDTIIRAEGVRRYIGEVKERDSRRDAAPPKELVFAKSKHVFHRLIHKKAYWECVRSFVESAMAS